jgi:subtilisin family serine protease
MLKEYVVCLHEDVDYNSFWDAMENDSSFPHIPNRPVDIANEKIGMDRSCHYYLTDEEASLLKQDSRIYCVEIPVHLRDDVQIGRLAIQNGNFTKTNTSVGSYVNWGLVRVNSPTNLYGTANTTTANYGYNLDATGVDVVISDSGIQADHPEFTNRVQLVDWYAISGVSGTQNANHYRDYDGHGTHVAGIVAGQTYGWAKNARIYSLKVSGLEGSGDSGTGISITDCFNVIKNWHLTKPINPKTGFRRPTIVNMSWGYSSGYNSVTSVNYRGVSYNDGSTTGDANYRWTNYGIYPAAGSGTTYSSPVRVDSVDVDVQELVKAGVIVCIAAGNSYFKIDTPNGLDYNNYVVTNAATVYYHRGMSPYSNTAIIVGSIDNNSYSNTLDQKATYSNAGPGVDIYSPGSNVVSSTSTTNIRSGVTYYANASYKQVNLSGTSMAAPQVVGMGALYLSMNPSITPALFKQWLKRNAASNVLYSSGFDADYTNTRSIYSGNNYIVFNPFGVQNNGTLYAFGSVPTAPTIGTATAANSFIANVTFTASSYDGGVPILRYTATSNTGISASGLTSPIIVDNLTPERSYNFVVTATTIIGTSANSSISNSIYTPPISYGSQTYSAGSYSFIVPRGVTSVSVVAVGGGASGGGTTAPYAGSTGGDSYFCSPTLVKGGGGGSGPFATCAGGSYAGGGGGCGGTGGNGGTGYVVGSGCRIGAAGGGGAGGYSGAGGHGAGYLWGFAPVIAAGMPAATDGAGGGGGGGVSNQRQSPSGADGLGQGFGGGGVGLLGQGPNGALGGGAPSSPAAYGRGFAGSGGSGSTYGGGGGGNYVNSAGPYPNGDAQGKGGGGGGLGWQNNISVTPLQSIPLVVGAAGTASPSGALGSVAGAGAVRVVWPGSARQFPASSVGSP